MYLPLSEQLPQIKKKFPSLADIPQQDWDRQGIKLVQLEAGRVVQEGHYLDYAVLIMEGTVRMYKTSSGGREITLYRIQGGECCPLMASSILGNTEYEASVYVETQTRGLLIPTPVFRSWMEKHSAFSQFIFRSFATRILLMSRLLDSINFKSVRQRIAEFLLQRSELEGDTLVMTHDLLSVELGTAREVISRSLKSLEKEGIIALTRGKIRLINRTALTREIEF